MDSATWDIEGFPFSIAIAILFLLLLLSAFFSGSETALTRARRATLRVRGEHGDKGAKQAEKLLDQPERMLSTVLLGNNFVNIAASALATTLFVHRFGQAGILYATIAMTVVVLIFAEILPKTIAVAHPAIIACRVAAPMLAILAVLKPLVITLMAIIDLLKKVLRIPESQHGQLTHMELASMIDLSEESGVLDPARGQMLNNSLSLHEVAVKALMTPRKQMSMLDGNETVAACLDLVTTEPYSRFPVYLHETDNIIGIIHIRDLLKISRTKQRLCDAIIWKTPTYIPATKDALAQLFDFQSNRQHMALIVDEFGDIKGLITLEDIIEEIVGEIHDESDITTPPEMWPQPDGSLVTAATVALHDINSAMDAELPEEGATTISGLIVEILGDRPEGRLCMSIGKVRVEVLSVDGDWIRRVRIYPAENEDEE